MIEVWVVYDFSCVMGLNVGEVSASRLTSPEKRFKWHELENDIWQHYEFK